MMTNERRLLERAVYALDTLISTQPNDAYHTAEFEHADSISEEIWEFLNHKENNDAAE